MASIILPMTCVFFFPYLAFYLLAWACAIPVSATLKIFWGLHIVNALVLAKLWRWQRPKFSRQSVIFWLGLTLFFLLPGAYLEYPSDPWEHVRRIGQWEGFHFLHEHSTVGKFAYFWGWTFFHFVPPDAKPVFFDVYSTFWQLLLAYQFYRVMRKLGLGNLDAYLQVIGFYVLFGTNLFTFRYYALSSTPLAYVAYLRALELVLSARDIRLRRRLIEIPALLALMQFNHIQEPLFFLINAGVIGAYFYARLRRISERRLWYAAGVLGVLGVILAIPLSRVLHTDPLIFWSTRRLYLDTYGIHGLAALGIALVLRRRYPLLALLTWVPTLCLLYPPSAYVIRRVFPDDYATYRILFCTPLSIMIVLGIREGLAKLWPGLSGPRRFLMCSVLIFLVALPPWYPWRGRLTFAVNRVHPTLRLERQRETAKWFAQNRPRPEDKKLVTDILTRFGLEGYLGGFGTPYPWQEGFRTAPTVRTLSLRAIDTDSLLYEMKMYRITRVLVIDPGRALAMPQSRIGKWSGHWGPVSVDQKGLLTDLYLHTLEDLRSRDGWTRTDVPPFYWLYEATTDPAIH